jgi:hypothetical protein
MQNHVQASKSSFVQNPNTSSAPTAQEAWRFGATKTLPHVTSAANKLADQKKKRPV